MRPEDLPPPVTSDPVLMSRLSELNEACQRLVASVAASQARSQGLELIIAVLLATVTADGEKGASAAECVASIERMQALGSADSGAPFPDPKLLEDVLAILQPRPSQAWRPRVVLGGRGVGQGPC